MMKKMTAARDYAVSAWSGGTTTQLAIFPPEAKYSDRDFLWRVSSATVELEESDFTALPDYDRLIATLRGEIVLTHNGGAPLTLRPFEVHAFSGADATHSVGRCTDFNLMLRRGRASGTMEALHLAGSAQTSPAKGRGSAVSGAEEGCRPLAAEDSPACHSERSAAESKNPFSPASTVGTSIACPLPGETLLLYCAAGSCTVGAAIGRPPEAEGSPVCHSERSAAEPKNPSFPLPLRTGETLLCTDPIPLTLTGTADLMLCRIKVTNDPL